MTLPRHVAAGGPRAAAVLLAIPVFNEGSTIDRVLEAVRRQGLEPLVFDDGSTDDSAARARRAGATVVSAAENRGYGATMIAILRYAEARRAKWVITMDCDEQHEPESLPDFLAAIGDDDSDVVSGSRYLDSTPADDLAPADRRRINATMTEELNDSLGLSITDAFCGFKAYRVSTCAALRLTTPGYEFPMEFWARVAAAGLRIRELPIRRIYTDAARSFGEVLDDPAVRLAHYRETLRRTMEPCCCDGGPHRC